MKFLFIFISVALAYPINGQTCTCENNFEWVKRTFEENDAGFQYIIDKKGQAAYDIHNQLMLEKIKAAKTLTECTGLLYEWMKFFRSGHIGIERLMNEDAVQQNTSQTTKKNEIWETLEIDIPQFEKYLETKQEADYEGIWDLNGVYKMGIKKDGENYVGFVIESEFNEWKPCMVKMKIEQYDKDKLKTIFYWRDFSSIESIAPELIGKNLLFISQNTSHQQVLKRLSPIFPEETWETWETLEIDIPQFEKYLETKQEADYEGIWDLGGFYKMGIKKDGVNYVGFVIETKLNEWKPCMVKMKIEQYDKNKLKTIFYWSDFSSVESIAPELIGRNLLLISQNTFRQQVLKRISPIFPEDPFAENYFKAMTTQNPYLDKLNATTIYLRIPSFHYRDKPAIDKLIADNKKIILKTENLIIDLRYNGGGSDHSFQELLPFLYTNPIRTFCDEFLSTTLNNQQLLKYSTDPDIDKDTQKWAKNMYDKLQEKLGEFVLPYSVPDSVNPYSDPISVKRQKTIYKFPKNVGIIINEGNASATEQFLLAAKQSKKVKLFGVTTFGSLDISNLTSVESPCKEFRLWYCFSRSLGIPDMTIDDIGIQPDYYLDKTIPQYKWVEFVKEILNQ